ncbi:MAG: dipeptide/oligopeptide/nickel ABC transporter ATP-binding protein [Treponema sp.]|jgi:ABC-type dipeptide/oligopeptide/nickel transport system ATPase subunit|nr:dipeptide/oligopeptide/nickel ABC transporter ATP-binding protein [Treponema sp.]
MLSLRDITKRYPNGTQVLQGLNLTLEKGSILGLVGESGCGKSTLARIICMLEDFQGGDICLDGVSYRKLKVQERRLVRRRVQMVFQDASGSLDPRQRVFHMLQEPLRNYESLSRSALQKRVEGLLKAVGLDTAKAENYPHELSGGQRQRVLIARALATEPEYLICDEPVSSLDQENQERILALLVPLLKAKRLSCLFITHDISLAARVSGGILVMRAGKIEEERSACAAGSYGEAGISC